MATTNTKTTPATEIPATAQKIREQLVSTIRQGQQLSVDGAQTWAKAVSAVSVLPAVELPVVPGVPALPGVEAAAKFTFDLASDLLSAQRDFTLQLAKAFTPQK